MYDDISISKRFSDMASTSHSANSEDSRFLESQEVFQVFKQLKEARKTDEERKFIILDKIGKGLAKVASFLDFPVASSINHTPFARLVEHV